MRPSLPLQGDGVPVDLGGQDEIAQVGQVFNDTADRLRSLYETLQNSEAHLAEAARRVTEWPTLVEKYVPEMLDHPVAGWCLRNYVMLTEFPRLFSEFQLSEVEHYWNRYYWLFRFARVWSKLVGPDAGLEQQLSQFLDYPPQDEFESVLDIEAATKRDADA